VPPDPALAPVILPEIVPIVQLNVLGVDADNAILVFFPLQIVVVSGVITTGEG
jgi:hypothetical protein